MKKTKVLSTKAKRNRQGYLYVLPWVVGVLCFQFGPIVLSFFLSFTKYSMFGTPDFIGIENYNDIKEGDIIECFQMEEIKRG